MLFLFLFNNRYLSMVTLSVAHVETVPSPGCDEGCGSSLELSASFIFQNIEFASSLVKYFAPASFPKVRSAEGRG